MASMKPVIKVTLSVLALVAVTACLSAVLGLYIGRVIAQTPGTAPASVAVITSGKLAVTDFDSGKIFRVTENTVVSVSLRCNPSTGYSWSDPKIEGPALEEVPDIEYVSDEPPMPGSVSTMVVKFRAVKAGRSTISLFYARPWENSKPPEQTYSVTIVVEKAP